MTPAPPSFDSPPLAPDFVVIGAMKCATTSLCSLLAQQPGVFISPVKEPEYFCHEPTIATRTAYHAVWRGARRGQLRGEGSTSYTKSMIFPGVAARLHRAAPRARLIYLTRDPLKRIESHWHHMAAADRRIPEFNTAVREYPHLVDTSLYAKQLGEYRKFFADDQIKLCFLEDLRANPLSVLRECLTFLQLPPDGPIGLADSREHVSADKMRDLPLISVLRTIPGLRTAGAVFPKFKRRLLPVLRRRVKLTAKWDPKLRREVLAQIRPDSLNYLHHCHREPALWPSLNDNP